MSKITCASVFIGGAVAAICGIPCQANAETVPGPNVLYLAKGDVGDCGPGVVTLQGGASVLPPLPAIPGAPATQLKVRQLALPPPETPPRTGAPYSAVGTTEVIQTLADGNRIVHTNTSRYYRDSSGRVRTELSLSAVGPFTLEESNLVVMINDPVARQRFVLHPEQKRAEILPFAVATVMTSSSNSKQGANSTDPRSADAPIPTTLPPLPAWRCAPGASSDPAMTVSLGQKTLAGLTASGTRAEYTIPAGQIGNEQPITVTSEQWVSEELGVTLSSTRHDPMVGDTQFHLAQVERAEPDPSLFVLPPDYKVTDVAAAGKKVIIQHLPDGLP
jgi:hypothetical protein